MTHTKKLLSFIIPVYNENSGLDVLFKELSQYTNNLKEHYDYEIIFVDDGSSDDSWNRIKNFSLKDSCVKGISFSRNFGYQYALTAGYDYAQGDALITMDSDMQHPPSLIEKMVYQWENGFNIVYAQRINRDDTFLKKFTAQFYYRVLQTIGTITIPRNVSDFRLIDNKVATELRKIREKARYLRGLVAWLGFTYTFVEYEQPARLIGTTKYTWSKLFKIALDGIISFSKPFSTFFYRAILFFITQLIFIISFIIYDFLVNPINFFYWLIALLLILLGLQFFFIMCIGKKMEIIYETSKRRPLYIIINKINC